jgi:hypothetical protein
MLTSALFILGVGTAMRTLTTNLNRPLRAIREAGAEPAIVFLGFRDPSHLTNATRNSPDFDDSILVCRDLGGKNRALMNFYPDRRYFYLDAKYLEELGSKPDRVGWREIYPSMYEEP